MAYGEKDYEYNIFCKHEVHLVNQGLRFCNIGLDYTKCSECDKRESEHVKAKVTWASTGD